MFKDIQKDLKEKFPIIFQNKDIEEQVINKINDSKKNINRKLQVYNPFYNNQIEYKNAVNDYQKGKISIQKVKNNLYLYNKLSRISSCEINNKFWNSEIKKIENDLSKYKEIDKQKNEIKKDINDNIKITNRLLLAQWNKSLEKEYQKWELSEIEKYRKELLKNLEKWLKLVQQIQDVMNILSLETGLLFDLSKGNISLQDIDQLKKWAEFISQNEGVKKLCDMLGRLRRADIKIKKEIIQTTEYIHETVRDYTSNEEIVGVRIGCKLEHVLPQELALLGDEITSILFDKKFIEGELMCFDMEGFKKQIKKIDKEEVIEISEEEKMGPIIICVDTSASMSGSPETIAKAVTLYIASRAIKQKRNCYLINFSTSIETFDLSDKMGIKDLINFLRKSFHGGTDASPAIRHALKIMNEEDYKRADLLVISDFITPSFPENLEESIKKAKSNKNKFYSLAIGNIFLNKKLKNIFDNEWIYNPTNSSVTKLIKITNEISKKNNGIEK